MRTIRSPILHLPVQKRTNRDHISNVLLIQVFSDKDLQHTRQESEAGGNQWMKWIEGDAGHKSIDHGQNGISTSMNMSADPGGDDHLQNNACLVVAAEYGLCCWPDVD